MKIGVNRTTLPADWEWDHCLQAAKTAGFDSFEFNLTEDGILGLEASRDDHERIRETAQKVGIELSSLSSSLFWKYPLTSPDPQIAEKAQQVLHKLIETASDLQVKTALVVPGLVTADTPYEVAYSRSQRALCEALPFAQEKNVMLGIENVWNKFLLSPLEMARFIDELDHPNAGAYFDVGNVLVSGYPEHWIRILKHRIVCVHVKDFSPQVGNILGFLNPLQGDVNWQEVRTALAEIGYDGFLSAEVGGYKTKPELGLKHIAESLKAIWAS